MTDRARLVGQPAIPMALVGILVLVLVLNEVFNSLPEPGTVEEVCLGVCGCGACPPEWYVFVVIGLLVLVANYIITPGMPVRADEEDDE